ncbi:MAG: CPBP family intramembrane metalloprotease [Clostridia bacterium]|nr:CPBP family intramembrane metalloprotease [Clostridia bacterium]
MNQNFIHKNDLYYEDMPEEIYNERNLVSSIFIKLTLSSILAVLIIVGLQFVLLSVFDLDSYDSWIFMGVNELYTVVIALLFTLFTHKTPKMCPVAVDSMNFMSFFKYVIVAISIMVIGSLIGNGISSLTGMLIEQEVDNSVEWIIESFNTVEIIIYVVIIAPIIEELIFRKMMIDRLIRYGTKFCVVISGISFGLFHGNFYQFFYAAGLGALMSYMYCVYGKVRYTILLHMFINFMGSIVAINIQSWILSENVFVSAFSSLYALAYYAAIPLGVFIIVKSLKNINVYMLDGILVKPFKVLKLNFGFSLFVLYSVLTFAGNILL